MAAQQNAEETAGHVHGPDCDHDHGPPEVDMAELEANVMEVAMAMQQRFGDSGPTPEEEKAFMREWLLGKGRSEEEVDAILND